MMHCGNGFTAMKPSKTPLTGNIGKKLSGKALFFLLCFSMMIMMPNKMFFVAWMFVQVNVLYALHKFFIM